MRPWGPLGLQRGLSPQGALSWGARAPPSGAAEICAAFTRSSRLAGDFAESLGLVRLPAVLQRRAAAAAPRPPGVCTAGGVCLAPPLPAPLAPKTGSLLSQQQQIKCAGSCGEETGPSSSRHGETAAAAAAAAAAAPAAAAAVNAAAAPAARSELSSTFKAPRNVPGAFLNSSAQEPTAAAGWPLLLLLLLLFVQLSTCAAAAAADTGSSSSLDCPPSLFVSFLFAAGPVRPQGDTHWKQRRHRSSSSSSSSSSSGSAQQQQPRQQLLRDFTVTMSQQLRQQRYVRAVEHVQQPASAAAAALCSSSSSSSSSSTESRKQRQ
ncbi:hypothetical protein ENH_00071750 [Eimeria necatrix]|uniref:Uncharacterized protein n=1 Tax=Eimeria necatrix TaxID=51315 RepID=U6MMM0_9EIME|nr:hypothetical protein ENH_00071750 [Eimeria necatrix]CDJ64318.1 hypothetical protein ENH_00071750 [Eimeria necatrix]